MIYAKLIEGNLEIAPQNKGAVINYNTNIELMIKDGYKEFIETLRPITNRHYHIEYAEQPTQIKEVIVYDETQEEADTREAQRREDNFNLEFFKTSLGYIRRAVNMANGTHKDFLSDLLPTIAIGMSTGQAINIITYDKPPFDKNIEDWSPYQHIEIVTPQFIQECFKQLSDDFLPINKGE